MERYTIDREAGRKAYEIDCVERPTYHDGKPRKTWDELPTWAQFDWMRVCHEEDKN